MNRKKVEIEDINTLITSLMPKIGNESRHHLHSLISLVMSALILAAPLTTAVEAKSTSVSVVKTITRCRRIWT